MKLPEQYRYLMPGAYGRLSAVGNNGIFIIPHYRIKDYELRCVAGDQEEGWEHVSVVVSKKGKLPSRCPTWEEMCYIKDLFWNDDQEVMQFHPRKQDYVNLHEYCLHLWHPINKSFKFPNSCI